MIAIAPTDKAVIEAAPAKVNLTLHVTGKRPDGFHTLESLVVFSGVHDTLIAEPSDGFSLSITGPNAQGLEGEGDNIITRAAQRLADLTGKANVARLVLIKRLPVAAGIGGGSADAAATLRALNRLWGLDRPLDDYMDLAGGLGADVPVCLRGEAVTMAGIGEQLTPAPPLPSAWLVLVNPMKPVSTPAVFKARTGAFSPPNPLMEAPGDVRELAEALGSRSNDLAAPARLVEPVISDVLTAIANLRGCLLSRMSGSGATCFGLFADGTVCDEAAHHLAEDKPEWWVSAAPLVTRTTEIQPSLV
ncbi:MAG: 4-(cytidine 5'-diphospho)-2-C-methyl-D-erythritol kinase [Rhodospirillum sp.]|nr:4-(cytidine 5'-diphospho)-2-C-methyl-D-erythritol kinase [Rhodospirillum sp.]MCF8492032.1 4-(cytidine 5'-diphospho)-2-C-methyl-D-erythritol kinase [Rhodospirillum sp.]MCF8502257.1 4-(cytidine 5'-diphospho)-2-C-methyl-D-erythritol kinase [Rhodospirillum sp.]